MSRLTDETELYEKASDNLTVLRTNVIGGAGASKFNNVSIALEIVSQSISISNLNEIISFAVETVVDQMVLYVNPGGTCNSQITLEDNSGALFVDIQLVNNTSIVITDMNIFMDPSKQLTLSITQSSGCTVNGFITQRT